MLVVLAKGHGALAAQPGGEFFVGADQAVGAHGEHDGAQFVEHFVGALGLGGDLGVEADERIAQVVFDEHVVDAAGQRQGGDVMPARAFGVAPERDVGRLLFRNAAFGRGCCPHKQVADEVFDGVLFVEHIHENTLVMSSFFRFSIASI